MNIRSTITLTLVAVIAFAILLFIIQLLLKKLKSSSEAEESYIRSSYAVWFSTLFISASIIVMTAIKLLSEALDNINKHFASSALKETIKTASLFIGLSIVWFVIWYAVSHILSKLILEKRSNEMESENWSFFLIRGVLQIGLTLCLSTIFEIILRAFIPTIQIPFYH